MTGMAEERVIDLGYADPLGEPERSRAIVIGRLRGIGLGLLVLACLVAFGGATAPPSPAFTRVGVITWSNDHVLPDRLPTPAAGLLVTMTLADDVVAYYPDGRLAWRSPSVWGPTEEPFYLQIAEWDDVILQTRIMMPVSPGPLGVRTAEVESVALDPATGRELWRVRGAPRRVGELIVVSEEPFDWTQGLRIYRSLPDGLLWTVPPIRMTDFDPATDTLVTVTDEGRFTEYQLSTGTVRRSATLALPQVAAQLQNLTMTLLRDRVILRATASFAPQPIEQAVSYARATLQPLAQSPLDRVRRVEECGPVLCASSFDRTYILDKDTLAQLWYTTAGEPVAWTDSGLMVWSEAPRLVDERTGQLRVAVSGWEQVLRHRRSPGEPLSALLTRRAGRRTYVARLTPERVQVLGVVPQGLRECQHYHDMLWCQTDDDHTEIWRQNRRM